ncbi:MAG: hypothetical protein OFPII_00770 [Osedax symbiont Rs1]|nr:MAG: hypothetical protein OFPII_00770 [Osedax symbiont Rs1]
MAFCEQTKASLTEAQTTLTDVVVSNALNDKSISAGIKKKAINKHD